MGERSKYLTIIVREPTQDEASALIGHAKMSAASWSHAIEDRDAKDAEIADLRKELSEAQQDLRVYAKHQAERDESRRLLGELLAVIHRDGGQYQAEHGAAKAVEDGLKVVAELRAARDEARECVDRLFGALKSVADRSPILDDEGLDEEEHHCEWTLQHERKRIHAVIKPALAATPEHLR